MSRRKEFITKNNLSVNYTTLFLLPIIEYSSKTLPKEFISAYMIDKSNTQLALIFENTDSDQLKQFLVNIQTDKSYSHMDYDDDSKEVIVTFNFPKDFEIDFRLFKVGKYSKFSNRLKEILLTHHGRMTGNGKSINMIDALHPDYKSKKYRADQIGISINDLPNGEVISIPDMDKELYYKVDELKTIEKYINK